ncbi:family 2 glycosyl transferase [Salinisphaera sp. S4-8]
MCETANVRVVSHPYSKGNGAAIKTGARHARGDIIVFMDADGQHDPADIHKLLHKIDEGYDLVVGARKRSSQASAARWMANSFYNRFASRFVGQPVADLTSGFRACRAALFREFLHMLPNGFSYPTTSTMAFFRAGYSVGYVPINVNKRPEGSTSHIRLLHDGARFLLIIFRVGTLYSPLKLFIPISAFFFVSGLSYYGYTFVVAGRFTNGSALLLITSVLVFLIGLVSEQITQLLYASRSDS